ncbi:hypothetical protein L195_g019293, partial [Trifolium pratense]
MKLEEEKKLKLEEEKKMKTLLASFASVSLDLDEKDFTNYHDFYNVATNVLHNRNT